MGTETQLITAAQATKLQERSLRLQQASVRMTEALDLLGLPVDRPINMRTDLVLQDAEDMVAVEWQVPDAPADPPAPPKPQRKPRKRKKD